MVAKGGCGFYLCDEWPLDKQVSLPTLFFTRGPHWVDSSMMRCLFRSASGLTKMSSTPAKSNR